MLIVIDGIDGSGKATQTAKLVERLKNEGHQVETLDFPQYGEKSAGMVENYLEGKYGKTADAVSPYQASVFYAVDRFDASFTFKQWLDEGKIIVADRYVTANAGHQGSKIRDPQERADFFKWLVEFEHELMGIPRPDITIILNVDPEISQRLRADREKTDIHEVDLDHIMQTYQVYQEIADHFENTQMVSCTENNEILDIDTIHNKIWEIVSPLVTK